MLFFKEILSKFSHKALSTFYISHKQAIYSRLPVLYNIFVSDIMLVQNTIYKIIYKFFLNNFIIYHFLCNLCLSHVAATLRSAYSFQVISILFLTKISLVWCKKVVRDLHTVNRDKKYINCVLV